MFFLCPRSEDDTLASRACALFSNSPDHKSFSTPSHKAATQSETSAPTKMLSQPQVRPVKMPIARKEKEALLDDFHTNHPLKSCLVQKGKHQSPGRTPAQSIEDIRPVGGGFSLAAEAVVPMEIEDILPGMAECTQGQEPRDGPMDTVSAASYPTAAELYKASRMKPEVGRSWRTESTTQFCLFHAVKSAFLSERDTKSVGSLSRQFAQMVESVTRARLVDFRPLRQPRLDYASQQQIDPARVAMLESCAIHYNLDFGLVVRYLAGEYTAEHRDLGRLEKAWSTFAVFSPRAALTRSILR